MEGSMVEVFPRLMTFAPAIFGVPWLSSKRFDDSHGAMRISMWQPDLSVCKSSVLHYLPGQGLAGLSNMSFHLQWRTISAWASLEIGHVSLHYWAGPLGITDQVRHE